MNGMQQEHHASFNRRANLSMSWHQKRGSTGALSYAITTAYAMSNKLMRESTETTSKKIKELDENKWNATTCIIQLKSAFVNVLASEAGLHWRFELHNNYSVHNELQTYERINRKNKKSKKLEKMAGIRCIIHSRKVMIIMSPCFILIQTDTKAAQYYQNLP